MSVFFRFMKGAALGFELTPAEGVYLHLYLTIVEVVFISTDLAEELDE